MLKFRQGALQVQQPAQRQRAELEQQHAELVQQAFTGWAHIAAERQFHIQERGVGFFATAFFTAHLRIADQRRPLDDKTEIRRHLGGVDGVFGCCQWPVKAAVNADGTQQRVLGISVQAALRKNALAVGLVPDQALPTGVGPG